MDRISPSAIASFLACGHLTSLDRAAAAGEMKKPIFTDASDELLAQLGLAHERAFLDTLRASGEVCEIVTEDWSAAAAQTRAAMVRGVAVIYQATFLSPPYLGKADFLCRVEAASELGAWSYEVVDTKLARSTKATALLQLCFYSDQVARLQGRPPQWMHVELGGGRGRESFLVAKHAAYFRRVRAYFEKETQPLAPSYPEPVEFCATCDWSSVCDARWHADDHLSLVAGITRGQRTALIANGVRTLTELAAMPLEGVNATSLVRVREQARVQSEGRAAGRLLYEMFEEIEPERGLAALPVPSAGDVFFDIESDPYAELDGLEYLFGTVTADGTYDALWALSRGEEKQAFERFVDHIEARRQRWPDLHIYHYAPYETGAMKRLACRHNTRVDAIDDWLRAGLFVDLYRVVRQGLRASVESYSIKKIEALYGFTRKVALRDANASLGAFETWLSLGDKRESDRRILDTIARYNKDDCDSTWQLREWLEARRTELEAVRGPLPRKAPREGAPSEELSAHLAEVRAAYEALIRDVPDEARSDEQQARWLLAQLLEFHRREEKSFWWEYHRTLELSEDERVEDRSALGGLTYVGVVDTVAQSIVHRYRFPLQEHALKDAKEARDPETQKSAGVVVAIDDLNGTIDLKRGKKSQVGHPRALVPYGLIPSIVMSDSLLRLANAVTADDAAARAARDLLLRAPPRMREPLQQPHETTVAQATRVAVALDGGVLAIQGPPGAGKTYTGAHMIVALVRAGKRVGVTGGSHKVISNLLAAVPGGLRIGQKDPSGETTATVTSLKAKSNAEIAAMLHGGDLDVVGGTVWLWSDPALRASVDVLIIDEAGQMALANVLAASQCATNLVLLGDPQQLEQPLKGTHPPGAGVSALAHLLHEHATLAPDRGIFLAETRRMHASVCGFISEVFYEARLSGHASTAQQKMITATYDTGLHFVPVPHTGNKSESREEVAAVVALVRQLDGARWINEAGVEAPLSLEQILVVAPYNAQVVALREALPKGARVGTVDKFQGQEAAVVIYSLTTSTPDDAPRGMEFLYSGNRLNVAISRARCTAILVGSPALFGVLCKTPRQMQLANAFCRYLELAR